MSVNCVEHRKFMELVALRMKLEKPPEDGKDRDKILDRIKELENELKVN
jgi:hypothetical protein